MGTPWLHSEHMSGNRRSGGIWWQMSFADPDLPEHQQWLGGINTEADCATDAITWTHILGINPGGEIRIIGYRADGMDPDYIDRLITDPMEWSTQPLPVNPRPLPTPLPPELLGTGPSLFGPAPSATAPEQRRS
jgi:hypothetical protein